MFQCKYIVSRLLSLGVHQPIDVRLSAWCFGVLECLLMHVLYLCMLTIIVYLHYIFTRSCSCIFSTLYIKGIFVCSENFKSIFTSKCSQLISTMSKMIIKEWLGYTGIHIFRIICWLSFCSQDWMKLSIFMFYKSTI